VCVSVALQCCTDIWSSISSP